MAATPVSTITTALASADTDLYTIAAVGLGIGMGIVVLKKGYRLVKSFF